MSLNISAKEVKPLRVNYGYVARRIGDERPASRYQEAICDVQPTANFHYPPTWEPEKQLYDPSRTAIVMQDWYAFNDPRQYYYSSYVSARARQQESMENNFALIEKNRLTDSIPAALQDQVRQLLIPLR
ncbi:MAG: phenol hydroxylase, partial [Thiothrix sp.]|nr:phenol hydroxylase [Thiothrix sp.]